MTSLGQLKCQHKSQSDHIVKISIVLCIIVTNRTIDVSNTNISLSLNISRTSFQNGNAFETGFVFFIYREIFRKIQDPLLSTGAWKNFPKK